VTTLAEVAKKVEELATERDARIMASRRTIGTVQANLSCNKGRIGVVLSQEGKDALYLTTDEFCRLMGWFGKHCQGCHAVDEPVDATPEK
jgi:hypothetical protein